MSEPKADLPRRGVMLVLSSPSGAGKSTLSRAVLDTDDNIELSISATTRAKRMSEADGVHYHFMSQRQFEAMRDQGELLEWAEVHGNFYGTPRAPVEAALARGEDILFDIDWQGTLQLYESSREDVVSIFVLPPSGAELKVRLERRAEDDAETIAKRLSNAKTELTHWSEYDYVIVNDDLERALAGVRSILAAERLKRARSPGLSDFVDGLIADL
ncbi:guanylate kinase [Amorphus orientalis]|uniref:Guanylate kinase n=2 Tax=Amorphus orientalis TaxID=649198 RepID=A0AAE3VPC0_9HYPH|nr:guanylate kinase [Amorphus orientalis]